MGEFPLCQDSGQEFSHPPEVAYLDCMTRKEADAVRALIEKRLSELKLNRKEVSKALGRNETYLHQFLHRGTPAELHERDRARLAVILDVPESELRGPSTRSSQVGVRKTTAAPKEELDIAAQSPYETAYRIPAVTPGAELFGKVDLPVFGTAEGGANGALVVTDRAVDWVARPAALLRVQDGYGIIVAGDSMAPEHKPGSIALVNPHAKPRIGDSCIYRQHDEDGSTHILIKEYRGETETLWKVRQHNPPKDFTLPKSKWQVCHKTVGNYFA